MPGMVLRTPAIRVLMPVMVPRWREKSARVSYACLWNAGTSPRGQLRGIKETEGCTHSKISSVIWCELSIRPLSASNMSAAEDLCALSMWRLTQPP